MKTVPSMEKSPPTTGLYDALLFDMDGTILTSIPAVNRSWTAWAARVGASVEDVLAYMHGRRAIDTIQWFAPERLSISEEVAWLDKRELEDLDGIEPIEGAAALLGRLPEDRWAVVTSANRTLALKRIQAAGLPAPRVLVSSDDVIEGKPNPEGYHRAASTLGVPIEACLVFEDTENGISAGLSAGAKAVHVAQDGEVIGVPVLATIRSYRQLDVRYRLGKIHVTHGLQTDPRSDG